MKQPTFQWLMVYLILVFSSLLRAMHDENSYFHDHEDMSGLLSTTDEPHNSERGKKKRLKKRPSTSLYDHLEDNKQKLEIKTTKKAFQNIDLLFSQTKIKIYKSEPEKLIEDSTLHNYLSRPHHLKDIRAIIQNTINRKLSHEEEDLLLSISEITLPKAVKALWRNSFISDTKAHAIILESSTLTPKELIKLIENGIVKTASGYTIKLKTGTTFGDPLKLFQDVAHIIHKIKEHSENEETINLNNLAPNKSHRDKVKSLVHEGVKAEEILSDAHIIQEMRKHFLFISRIGIPIRFRPGTSNFYTGAGAGSVSADKNNYVKRVLSPGNLSATFIGNYYLRSIGSSITNEFYVNPLGISYYGALNSDHQGLDWWLSYSDGYLGGGSAYTVNFDQGTFWSNGQSTFLTLGLMAGGWRDYLTAGFSLSTMLANSLIMGINATVSISRSHDVSYLGQYPADGKFASIRGLHKIEINDTSGISLTGTIAINPAATIPINVAFRAGREHTKKRVYRTHVAFDKVHTMISGANIRGVLLALGQKIKESRMPNFDKPETMIEGDELVETKTGRLSGAFVIGVQSTVPIGAARIGGVIDITGEFELGVRKFPNEKYEVSIEPRKVYEFGLFASLLNIMGAGWMKSIAIARKQIFMFDFLQVEAKRAYFDLVYHGRLPTSQDIEVYTEDRGPEYVLTEFRAQNQVLKPRGIARTYLEKIRIDTTKTHVGINSPLVSAMLLLINKIDKKAKKTKERMNLKFEGIDRDVFRSQAKSVATNGIISVKRQTYGGRRSEGQGFSGRYNQDLYVTHRRIHAIDDNDSDFPANKWQFDSLIVHAQLEDTIITGNEENEMAQKINSLFGTFIGSFEYTNSKSPRVINIERELTKRDLHDLTRPEAQERIPIASLNSGIEEAKLILFLKNLQNKHADHQGLMVKQFIEESSGLSGFAAIHQLLGGLPEQLVIRTESGYTNAVVQAKKFIANFSNTYFINEKPTLDLSLLSTKKNKKLCRYFFVEAAQHLRTLDNQLRLLYDDKYLIDDNSPLVRIYGEKKIRDLVNAGARQDKSAFKSSLVSARKAILELMDFDHQNYTPEERFILYKMAGKKRLGLKEHTTLLVEKYKDLPLNDTMTEVELRKRFRACFKALASLDKTIDDYKNDLVMIAMDKDYVDSSVLQLTRLRNEVLQLISLENLSDSERRAIKDKLEHHQKFLQKISRHKHRDIIFIDGALAQTLRQKLTEEKQTTITTHEDENKTESSTIITSADSSSDLSDSSFEESDDEHASLTHKENTKLHYAVSRKRIRVASGELY